MHESFEPHHKVRAASPRAFGLMLVALCVVIAFWPLVAKHSPRWWVLAPGALAAVLAWWVPQVFALPNRAWMKLGELLARVVAPVALALLYFGMFVPMGWLMRAFGRDPLRLARDPAAVSYWIERDPPGPPGDSLTHPF
jgi:Saxitoxin biosynthesis operon protein SxtJ